MQHPDHKSWRRFIVVPAMALLVACGQDPEPAPTETTDAADADPVAAATPASVLPVPAQQAIGCGEHGMLQATLYGALAGDVSWQAQEMFCEGMPRPDNAGARLRFAGTAGDPAIPIAFIVAIPGLERGVADAELPSVVTVIEEGRGRFFSTPDLSSCWTDVSAQDVIEADSGTFSVDGEIYCISPIPEVQGNTSLSIQEMRFSGFIDWGTN